MAAKRVKLTIQEVCCLKDPGRKSNCFPHQQFSHLQLSFLPLEDCYVSIAFRGRLSAIESKGRKWNKGNRQMAKPSPKPGSAFNGCPVILVGEFWGLEITNQVWRGERQPFPVRRIWLFQGTCGRGQFCPYVLVSPRKPFKSPQSRELMYLRCLLATHTHTHRPFVQSSYSTWNNFIYYLHSIFVVSMITVH